MSRINFLWDNAQKALDFEGEIIVVPYKIAADEISKLEEEMDDLRKALSQDEHYVIFEEDGWSIEHLVECRPNMTKCEFHQRMQEVAFENNHRRGRYMARLKPLRDLEFTAAE